MPAPPPASITVVIVEDDPAAMQRFTSAIDAAPDMRVLRSFTNARDALAWLEHHGTDVLLADLGLPDLPGLLVIANCAQRHPMTDIMVITMYEDEAHVIRSLEAGASGYLLKDCVRDEIPERIRELRAGGAPMTPVIARQVLRRFRVAPASGQAVPVPALLTQREMTVLNHVARGFSYGEIARLEGVATTTVASHIRHIYEKLAVHSRSEAVFEAQQMGLLDPVAPRRP
ncbi:MAG: response regulator transcription factor [Pseudorhodoferax sp.]